MRGFWSLIGQDEMGWDIFLNINKGAIPNPVRGAMGRIFRTPDDY